MSVEIAQNRRQKDCNGKIYIIRNSINDLTYVGSTCQTLAQRMAEHRNGINKKGAQHYKLYQAMSELGKDAFYIELIEDYPCQTRGELLKKEGEQIREYQSKLNKIVSGRNWKEYYNENRQSRLEHSKEYNEKNKTQIKERRHQHYLSLKKKWQNETANTTKTTKKKFYSKRRKTTNKIKSAY